MITVLIISALVLMVAIGISLESIGEMKMGLQRSLSSQSYYLVNLCAEEALMTLKQGGTYTEKVIKHMENGDCTIEPIEGSWTIKVSASSSGQFKKMKLVVSQINPEIIVDSWEEVAEF